MDKKEKVFEKIKEMIVEELGVKPEKVVMDAGLAEDFGADSLDALELFNQIESEFLISISDEAASDMKDVKDLVEYVAGQVSDSYFE
ncbi:MAG: acyl carrier protein [Candidatus Izemoplasmatales bacterium]|jgi:acyl carrier protein|nr:acyl carrier protein [Candidatus Izemoplasmatales bacterium]MDD4069482.1 acyl carrier protein [Candidatus Izemoplasmatales bacterium]MDY0139674.1 acyl carrier protein [Candidatus Izemoplasmatales bacterium]